MKDKKIFLHKVRVVAVVLLLLVTVAGIGIGYNRQMAEGQVLAEEQKLSDTKETSIQQTEIKKRAEEAQRTDWKRFFCEEPSGSLLNAAVYKIVEKTPEAEEEGYGTISTCALAQEALERLEQGTIELMASPAGSVWGGRIKVYAGETPLLITEEDKEVLLRIVEAEATCEDVKGRMLVANVILNRVLSEDFPDSITEVVFQNNGVTYQFSPIKDGRYWTVKISEETKEAVERVLAGEDYSGGALYFAARSMAQKEAMRWFDSSLQYLFQHGVHEFFTDK